MAKTTKKATAQTGQTPQKKPVKANALLGMASLLSKYAEQFDRLGKHMVDNSIESVEVRGSDGVKEFMKRLDSYYANCSSEIGFLKIGEPKLSYFVSPDKEKQQQ